MASFYDSCIFDINNVQAYCTVNIALLSRTLLLFSLATIHQWSFHQVLQLFTDLSYQKLHHNKEM